MKTLLGLILLLLLVVTQGCSGDKLAALNSVQREFPNAIEIKTYYGKSFHFAVFNNDSTIWNVETMSKWNDNVTGKELLFDLKHK